MIVFMNCLFIAERAHRGQEVIVAQDLIHTFIATLIPPHAHINKSQLLSALYCMNNADDFT